MEPQYDLLLDVAAVTRAVPAKRFRMRTWWGPSDCGTVGCAIGHYLAARPHFPLRLVEDAFGFVPRLNSMEEFPALKAFFRISMDDVCWLFSSKSYGSGVTPAEVADRIEHWVRERRPADPLVVEMKPERTELVTA